MWLLRDLLRAPLPYRVISNSLEGLSGASQWSLSVPFATSFFPHYTLCRNMQHISKLLVMLFPLWNALLPPPSTVKISLTFQGPNPYHLSVFHHDRDFYLREVFSRLPGKFISFFIPAHSSWSFLLEEHLFCFVSIKGLYIRV